MKIVVVGGSGLIGTKLVNKLRERGHEVLPASPKSGVDTLTGEGLAEALQGAQVVVDVTNAPSWEDAAVMKFFETSTRNLLAYEAAAGVGHHVALSVVGTERLLASGPDELRPAVHAVQGFVLELHRWLPPAFSLCRYSDSRRSFLRLRLRASACLARRLSPGFK